jgi:hypothetical protein
MAIPTKESSQDKASNKVDKNWNKKKRELPLMEREFRDLVTLKDQLDWIKQKRRQLDKEDGFKLDK